MTVYYLSINNGENEYYSLKSFRDDFKRDNTLFEFLKKEEYLFCYKKNGNSRRQGIVYPLTNNNVKIVWDGLEKQRDGAYGN
jgi:hypothetical protein